MKTDAYSKIILTIIAVCLAINVLKDMQIIQSAQAKAPETKLVAPQSSTIDVRIVGWDASSYNPVYVKVK
ncbi:hypothetical protein [Bacteroides sp.]